MLIVSMEIITEVVDYPKKLSIDAQFVGLVPNSKERFLPNRMKRVKKDNFLNFES